MHTSTVTVDVYTDFKFTFNLNRNDVSKKYTRGSGKGGQNRNKVETVVVLTHQPSNITVRVEEQRTRDANERVAWKRLEERVKQYYLDIELENWTKTKIGTARSDKRRTYRCQENIVVDHISNKKCKLKDVLRGDIFSLHLKN